MGRIHGTNGIFYLAIYQTTKIDHSCRQICQSHGSYGKVTVASYADVDCNLEIFYVGMAVNHEIQKQADSLNHITCSIFGSKFRWRGQPVLFFCFFSNVIVDL